MDRVCRIHGELNCSGSGGIGLKGFGGDKTKGRNNKHNIKILWSRISDLGTLGGYMMDEII